MKKKFTLACILLCLVFFNTSGCDSSSNSDDNSSGITIYLLNNNDYDVSDVTIGGKNFGDIDGWEYKEIKIEPGTYDFTWEYNGTPRSDTDIVIAACDGDFCVDIFEDYIDTYCDEDYDMSGGGDDDDEDADPTVVLYSYADATIYNVTIDDTNYGEIDNGEGGQIIDIDRGTYTLSWEYDGSTYIDNNVEITSCDGYFWIDIYNTYTDPWCDD